MIPYPKQGLGKKKRAVLCGGILLSLLLIACAGWSIGANRRAALKDAGRELENLALALSESTDRSFQTSEIVHNATIAYIKTLDLNTDSDLATIKTFAFHESLKRQISNIPCLDSVSVIDTKGSLLNTSRNWPAPIVNVADRTYFKVLMATPSLESFISEPLRSKAYGTWTVYIVRRLTGANGNTIAFVLAAMDIGFLERSYSSFAMSGGRVSLFRQDGIPLARYPHIDSDYQKSFAALPIFNGLLATRKAGSIIVKSIVDKADEPRLLAFNRLEHYPLSISISKSVSSVLSDWESFALFFSAVTAVLVLFVALAVPILWRSIDRIALEERNARLASESERLAQQATIRHAGQFEVALNNMLHGLSMFDGADRLIVCNKRYADMYALPPELTKPGTSRPDIVRFLCSVALYDKKDMDEIIAQYATSRVGENHIMTRRLSEGRIILIRSQAISESGWVDTHEDITDRRNAENRLIHMARHDALTGLSNRIVLQERMEQALLSCREGLQFAVFCLDLDHFKEVNDLLGHSVGDRLLQDVSARLERSIKGFDTVSRIGGDEFAIIQMAIDGWDDANVLAARIVDLLSQPYSIMGHRINIGVSIGVAYAPRDGVDGERLLSKADIALYQAKLGGRRGYRFFEPEMEDDLQKRLVLELDLRKALERDELEVFFQPLIDTRTKMIRSFEALVRWRHPDRGFVPPLEFIPVAEGTGLIGPLGEWILSTACREATLWPQAINLAVNISVSQFKLGNLVEMVSNVLASIGLAPSRLALEITESVLLDANDKNVAILHALRDLGVKIVMDDFGTGYSSLSYLRVFPFDKIKIDKSFVQDIDQISAKTIVRLICELGRMLGMETTAEGVETQAQFEQVTNLGCTEIQGFLFSKPVARNALPRLIDRQATREAA